LDDLRKIIVSIKGYWLAIKWWFWS